MIIPNFAAAKAAATSLGYPPPAGDYVFTIKSLAEKYKEGTSEPFILAALQVDEGEHEGRVHLERFEVTNSFGGGKFLALLEAIGSSSESLPGDRGSVDLPKLVGKKFRGRLSTTHGKTGTKNEGKSFTNLAAVEPFDPSAAPKASGPEPWEQRG